jgi:streptogramin lyase
MVAPDHLAGVVFTGAASFDQAEFLGPAGFVDATFTGTARFDRARSGPAPSSGARSSRRRLDPASGRRRRDPVPVGRTPAGITVTEDGA